MADQAKIEKNYAKSKTKPTIQIDEREFTLRRMQTVQSQSGVSPLSREDRRNPPHPQLSNPHFPFPRE